MRRGSLTCCSAMDWDVTEQTREQQKGGAHVDELEEGRRHMSGKRHEQTYELRKNTALEAKYRDRNKMQVWI